MSEEKNTPEVPEDIPHYHPPGTPNARLMDLAMHQMETGNPDGDVVFDESSETFSNIFPAELGTGSQALNRRSSNYEMRLKALEEREKAADPDAEFEVTNQRAYEKWEKEMEAIEAAEAKAEEQEQDDE